MPFDLRLPKRFRKAKWKVKIREKETREPPHVTILHSTQSWRINLRTGEFMDGRPDPSVVPEALVGFLRRETVWRRLCHEWDQKYPENPVGSED